MIEPCPHQQVDYSQNGVVVDADIVAVHKFECAECRVSARVAYKATDTNG